MSCGGVGLGEWLQGLDIHFLLCRYIAFLKSKAWLPKKNSLILDRVLRAESVRRLLGIELSCPSLAAI